MNIVTNSASLIVMSSDSGFPTPPAGGRLFTLTQDQAQTLTALSAQPNGGISFDGAAFTTVPYVAPTPFDFSNIDNLDKTFRAIGLMIANFTGKTPAQVKQAYLNAWNALP